MSKKNISGLIFIILLTTFFLVYGIVSFAADEYLDYYVQPGDSLYKISRQYNTTITDLKTTNNLQSDIIYVGQKLIIPVQAKDSSDFVYYVKAGDSLYKLAEEYQTTITALKEKNNLYSDMIYIGQKLIIPGKSNSSYAKLYSIKGRVNISNRTLGTNISRQENKGIEIQPLNQINNPEKYKNAEIIVKYKPLINSHAVEDFEDNHNLFTINNLQTEKGQLVHYKIPETTTVEEAVKKYSEMPGVDWAEPNYIFYPTAVPGDPLYSNYQWNQLNLNLEAAWDLEKGDRSVTVAVVDTGIIPTHPDLQAHLLQGADFVGGDRNYPVEAYNISDYDPTDETTASNGGSHGTHVAGIIGAVSNNYQGIAGINWDIRLLPVRVLKKTGGTSWDIAEGIYYAIEQGVDIINLSLGSNYNSNLQQEAIQTAYQRGIVIIAATGNENSTVYYPAAFPETIAVGAVGKNNTRSSFSNYGPEVDVVAPGGDYGQPVYSTWGYYLDGSTIPSYTGMIGTSMAAPHVSGVAALLIANGVQGVENVRSRLISSAIDLGTEGKDNYYGNGLVDAYAALLGRKIENPVVFTAVKDGNIMRVKSDIKRANDNGNFSLTGVKAGQSYLIAWRDINNNQIIDAGDYYGESSHLLNISGNQDNVELLMGYLSYKNSPGYRVYQ